MDEATACLDRKLVDVFTERFNQEFGASTVIVIAHDLRSVLGLDRVLVFDQGRVIQDGPPKELLKDVEGAFYGMWVGN